MRILPKLGEWGVNEVASFWDVVVKAAAARKGISAEAGLTVSIIGVGVSYSEF